MQLLAKGAQSVGVATTATNLIATYQQMQGSQISAISTTGPSSNQTSRTGGLRPEEANQLVHLGLLTNLSANGKGYDIQSQKNAQAIHMAIQNLTLEQEKIITEIFAQNKHIDANNLNLIIHSQLNQAKSSGSATYQGMLGQKHPAMAHYRNVGGYAAGTNGGNMGKAAAT